ncbi:MAG: acetyl-CoA carboxylase biotin carboxylase subunit [Planctomycetota bacterium]|jgi:acetyl-CoA carboxylase biotin carboxylase subunit|nr:acetyl-CoA carboxylase biotin carboxylase subunit [Planctomycetota bacterium]
MFKRVLVANRGEIACRIIRACRKLGVETVAVYSEADRESLHVRLAGVSICIGPPDAARSYLHIPAIISAAEISDVDAIHPGYGFLSENGHFADICRGLDIAFVGPSPGAMAKLSDKAGARELAKSCGIPILPGSEGKLPDDETGLRTARGIGYPVIVKASAGGGGRGIRVAHNDAALRVAMSAARTEAEANFGDGSLYIEKFLGRPRHVEVQVLADEQGAVVHLGERDCTTQRRHQKLIEESPSPAIDSRARRAMGAAAVKLCQAAGYTNAGTVEFLFEDGEFFFMEMNTRIQVEHPVTEMVTGLDLIEEQLRLAAGEPLRWRQKDIRHSGHAMEFRINAEDPESRFAPSPGQVTLFVPPEGAGIRTDSFMYSGYRVTPYYDSLLAKLIVHAGSRADCLEKSRSALREFILEGVKTTIPFHLSMLENNAFVQSEFDIDFVDRLYG